MITLRPLFVCRASVRWTVAEARASSGEAAMSAATFPASLKCKRRAQRMRPPGNEYLIIWFCFYDSLTSPK